jgi:DUF3037 family protein
MPEERQEMFQYRILRYTPNLIRDEWVNIGVLLQDAAGRQQMRMLEDGAGLARVRRLHPNADLDLLRALPSEFEARLHDDPGRAAAYLEKLDETLSNALQFGPVKGLLARDFDSEIDRLYREHIAPPVRARGGILETTRDWIKARLEDVFRRRRVPLQRDVRVEEFTEPGDPLRLDYAYQNGVRGYLQSFSIRRDSSQAKVLAYTAERIRARIPACEFTAITEIEPEPENRRHQFVSRLFASQNIAVVPLNRIERFAEDLRVRLQ